MNKKLLIDIIEDEAVRLEEAETALLNAQLAARKNLRRVRRLAEISLKSVADAACCVDTYICGVEQGRKKCSPRLLRSLKEAIEEEL